MTASTMMRAKLGLGAKGSTSTGAAAKLSSRKATMYISGSRN